MPSQKAIIVDIVILLAFQLCDNLTSFFFSPMSLEEKIFISAKRPRGRDYSRGPFLIDPLQARKGKFRAISYQ